MERSSLHIIIGIIRSFHPFLSPVKSRKRVEVSTRIRTSARTSTSTHTTSTSRKSTNIILLLLLFVRVSLNAVDKKCYSVKHTIQYTRVNTA